METLKEIAKDGIVLGIVGVLLALAAPHIATMIGEATLGSAAFAHAMSTPVIWTGAFFGAFGAIHAAVAPMLDAVFGKEAASAAAAPMKTASCAGHGHGHGIQSNNTQIQPDIAVAANVDMNASNTKSYAKAIEAEHRNAPHLQLVK